MNYDERGAHLVLIIFKNALMEVKRVTICALPVCASVTVMVGHEKAKNSSKEVKRCPHVLSNLLRMRYRRQMNWFNCK